MRIRRMEAGFVLALCLPIMGWGVAAASGFSAFENEVTIHGELPRHADGAIDLKRIREAVAERAAQGAREVQFLGFTLTRDEAHRLFLALDRDQNLLRLVAEAIPADGMERRVALRGLVDGRRVEGLVQRREDGTLRMRLNDVALGELGAAERERLVQGLARTGFDRVRLEGIDQKGDQVRLEFRADKGLLNNEIREAERGKDRGTAQVDVRYEDRREDRWLDRRAEIIQRTERLERIERPDRSRRPERIGR